MTARDDPKGPMWWDDDKTFVVMETVEWGYRMGRMMNTLVWNRLKVYVGRMPTDEAYTMYGYNKAGDTRYSTPAEMIWNIRDGNLKEDASGHLHDDEFRRLRDFDILFVQNGMPLGNELKYVDQDFGLQTDYYDKLKDEGPPPICGYCLAEDREQEVVFDKRTQNPRCIQCGNTGYLYAFTDYSKYESEELMRNELKAAFMEAQLGESETEGWKTRAESFRKKAGLMIDVSKHVFPDKTQEANLPESRIQDMFVRSRRS